jgi:hypothetical protein
MRFYFASLIFLTFATQSTYSPVIHHWTLLNVTSATQILTKPLQHKYHHVEAPQKYFHLEDFEERYRVSRPSRHQQQEYYKISILSASISTDNALNLNGIINPVST